MGRSHDWRNGISRQPRLPPLRRQGRAGEGCLPDQREPWAPPPSLPLPSQEEGPGQELAAEAAPTRTFGVVPDDNPQDRNMKPILLDGKSLTQRQLAGIAYGAPTELSADALRNVARAAEFLAEQVRREEPIYDVSTG